ncbi:MAG: response regulator [Nitrospirota bacterium]
MTTPKNLLIVARNPDTRERLEDLLFGLGYGFRTVANQSEALMMLQRWHFDGLLLDVDPPANRHSEVRRFLRERGMLLPVLLLVKGSDASTAEGLETYQGTETVLPQPIKEKELGQWLSQSVGLPGERWSARTFSIRSGPTS